MIMQTHWREKGFLVYVIFGYHFMDLEIGITMMSLSPLFLFFKIQFMNNLFPQQYFNENIGIYEDVKSKKEARVVLYLFID